MSRVIVEKIFDDRINTISLSHEEPEGTPTDWSGTDHMVLDLINKTTGVAITQIDPAPVNFSTNGILIFTLGEESIAIATYKVELVAVAVGGAKTQVIQWDRDKVEFTFLDTEDIT